MDYILGALFTLLFEQAALSTLLMACFSVKLVRFSILSVEAASVGLKITKPNLQIYSILLCFNVVAAFDTVFIPPFILVIVIMFFVIYAFLLSLYSKQIHLDWLCSPR